MKRILFSFLLVLTFFSLGCNSSRSLDRTPVPKRQKIKKKSVPKVPKKKKKSDDPLYDAIFHRNPQKFDIDSKLTKRERELMQEYDVRNDSTVRQMHEKNRKSNSRGSDWVFGTKNGSYF